MIAPEQIEQACKTAVFDQTRGRAGYDQHQVDTFLDHIVIAVADLRKDVAQAQGRAAELVAAPSPEKAIVQAAHERAVQIVGDAEQRRLQLVAEHIGIQAKIDALRAEHGRLVSALEGVVAAAKADAEKMAG